MFCATSTPWRHGAVLPSLSGRVSIALQAEGSPRSLCLEWPTSEKGASHTYSVLLLESFPWICLDSGSGLSWITLPVLCFVLPGFFEHQIYREDW